MGGRVKMEYNTSHAVESIQTKYLESETYEFLSNDKDDESLLLVTRKQWKARSPRSISRHIYPDKGGIVLHYNGGRGRLSVSDHSKCASLVRNIQNDHMDNAEKKWNDIAYTFLVCVHGYIFEGRGIGVRTAANGTTKANQNYYAVMALVNESDSISEDLANGIKDAIRFLINKGGARNVIIGHRDCKPTSCPGSKLYSLLIAGSFNIYPKGDGDKFPGETLKEWVRGNHVRRLQERLLEVHGYKRIKVDGIFGPITKEVVKSFQKKNKLRITGEVDSKTWSKIFN